MPRAEENNNDDGKGQSEEKKHKIWKVRECATKRLVMCGQMNRAETYG
jgi:hypothetical protein